MPSMQFWVPLVLAADDEIIAAAGTPTEWLITNLVGFCMLVGLVLFTYTTKAGIVARATTKEAVRQPVFLLSMAVAILILLINTVLPFYSLGDDVKMLKDCSLATILISGLLIAVWTASTSIAEEIVYPWEIHWHSAGSPVVHAADCHRISKLRVLPSRL
jgi:hypothetical protein